MAIVSAALGVVLGERRAAEVVTELLDEAETARKDHEQNARVAEGEAAEKERELKELEARRRDLTAREPEWRAHADRAERIGQYLGMVVDSRTTLDSARSELVKQVAAARRAEDDAHEAGERLLQQARELLAADGPFPAELLKLKDQIGAELVAGSFEDIGLDEAARLEARLGALAQALVVDDPSGAAQAIAQRSVASSA